MSDVYDIGDQVRVTTTFTDLAGVVADPSTVTCDVKTPRGVSTAYVYGTDASLTKTSTGIYNLDLDLTEAGTWAWKFNGSGSLKAADQGRISVRKSLA